MSISGCLIILVFLCFSLLMIIQRLPALLALPAMAILISIIARIHFNDIFVRIIGQGTIRLQIAMTASIFGAILAQVITKTGISNRIIKLAAELGGDKPLIASFCIAFATAIMFTSLSGLGAVIMVGTIAIPILMSLGIKPLIANSMILIAINLGGVFNIANYAFYESTLKFNITTIKEYASFLGILLSIILLIFILINIPIKKTVSYWAMPINSANNFNNSNKVSPFSLMTPIIPVVLVFIWPYIFHTQDNKPIQLDIITAMIIGILYGIMTTKPKEIKNLLTSSFIEGIKDAAPVIALMIGLGMLLVAVTDKATSSLMAPIISFILPSSKIGYISFFTLLSPLALYRGPLNLYGLGSGIAILMISANILPGYLILGAMLTIASLQGICDPTNTHNVWISNYTNTSTSDILKKTLPYTMILVLVVVVFISIFKF